MGDTSRSREHVDSGTKIIDRFRDEYGFLSNFHLAGFKWRGVWAPSSEHHYMADKTDDPAIKAEVYAAHSPGQAKRLGKKLQLRPGWDAGTKYETMQSVLEAKFAVPHLQELLLGTGDALLAEGNEHHDQVWGDCACSRHRSWPGQNHLGRTLMGIRAALRGDPADHWPRVALTGHRPEDFTNDQWQWVKDTLAETMTKLYQEHGTRVAISGLSRGADAEWANTAITKDVHLWAYIPFEGQASRWSASDQTVWREQCAQAQCEVVLGENYDVRLLHARNELMIRNADMIIAVHQPTKTTGGTATTIRKARAARKPLLRINPTSREVALIRPP